MQNLFKDVLIKAKLLPADFEGEDVFEGVLTHAGINRKDYQDYHGRHRLEDHPAFTPLRTRIMGRIAIRTFKRFANEPITTRAVPDGT